jgi:CRISPR-associated protein Cas2
MRHTYVVTYDICDPKRLRKVYKLMLGWGDHLQLSVFQCELSHRELVEVRVQLDRIIKPSEDQVLFVDLGTAEGRGSDAITSLGRPYVDPERVAIVV